MDLLKLQKKAILIPTPGQPEQEYLGRYLARRQLAVVADQATLNLPDALAKIDLLKTPKVLEMEGYKEFCSADVLFRS
jgi:UDP-N-acetylglucosamine:LPS N-acetylglucosamine transferase